MIEIEYFENLQLRFQFDDINLGRFIIFDFPGKKRAMSGLKVK